MRWLRGVLIYYLNGCGNSVGFVQISLINTWQHLTQQPNRRIPQVLILHIFRTRIAWSNLRSFFSFRIISSAVGLKNVSVLNWIARRSSSVATCKYLFGFTVPITMLSVMKICSRFSLVYHRLQVSRWFESNRPYLHQNLKQQWTRQARAGYSFH